MQEELQVLLDQGQEVWQGQAQGLLQEVHQEEGHEEDQVTQEAQED